MTPEECRKKLVKFGLKLDLRSETMLAAFYTSMEGRQYGTEETSDAFLWFEAGWQAARNRLA